MLQAGTGISTITPPLGCVLSGSFEERFARTVQDDLHVRTLVLEHASVRLALVLCDVICLGGGAVQQAKKLIEQRSGIPASHVMISCTHTHTAPATVPLLIADPDPAYIDWLVVRIADAVEIACQNLGPARIASGATDVGNVCFNRRFHMKDGTVVFNPGIRNPDIVNVAGPVDPQVTAMIVERPDGTPVALWANLSLHYVGTDDPYAVSADYYGQYADFLARTLGESCVGMLTNGTSGNINNVDVSGATGEQSTGARAAQVAGAVAAGAISATWMAPFDDAPVLDARLIPFEVTRRPITGEDIELARTILDGTDNLATEALPQFSFVTGQPIPAYQLRAYAREVLELADMPESTTTSLQILRIGDIALVGLPGEIFVELGLAIKSASPYARTAVVSLANDYVGYVPTIEAFSQGAYETWAARSAWPAPGTGEAMVDTVLQHLR